MRRALGAAPDRQGARNGRSGVLCRGEHKVSQRQTAIGPRPAKSRRPFTPHPAIPFPSIQPELPSLWDSWPDMRRPGRIYRGVRRRQHRARMAVLVAALGVLAVLAVRGLVMLWQWLAP